MQESTSPWLCSSATSALSTEQARGRRSARLMRWTTNCESEPENEVGRSVGIGVAEVEANQPGTVRVGFAARGSRFAIALTAPVAPTPVLPQVVRSGTRGHDARFVTANEDSPHGAAHRWIGASWSPGRSGSCPGAIVGLRRAQQSRRDCPGEGQSGSRAGRCDRLAAPAFDAACWSGRTGSVAGEQQTAVDGLHSSGDVLVMHEVDVCGGYLLRLADGSGQGATG